MKCHINCWSHKILLRPCNNVCQRHFSKICIIVSIIGYWTLGWMIAIFIRPNINFVLKGRVLFARGSTYCPIVRQNLKDMVNFRDHRILHRCLETLSVVELFYFRMLTLIENFSPLNMCTKFTNWKLFNMYLWRLEIF
jgi:hypothetical protein